MTRRRRIRTAVVVLLVLLALGFIFRGEAEPEVEPGSTLVLRVSGAYAETVEAPLLARLLGEAREPFLDLLSTLALAERDDRIETLLRRCVRDRDQLPADQSIDVLFHEFMADDIGTVERIYDLAGHPMTDGARKQLDDYMLANPRGKYGRVRYDLKQDFGIDPDVLRKRFEFYFDRFPIRAER